MLALFLICFLFCCSWGLICFPKFPFPLNSIPMLFTYLFHTLHVFFVHIALVFTLRVFDQRAVLVVLQP